jgi:hypothetical protein
MDTGIGMVVIPDHGERNWVLDWIAAERRSSSPRRLGVLAEPARRGT